MLSALQLLRNAKRKTLLGSRPMWQPHAPTSAQELHEVGQRVHKALPEELVAFLLEFGFGDINDELSFRRDWFNRIESGPLSGYVVFGQDELGNFYTMDPSSKAVHCMSRSEPGYCYLASSFNEFIREVAMRGFKVREWVEAQPLLPHAGAA